MEKKTIGAFIAALRKANGMTQQEVADRLNISNKAVSRWERDECVPDLSLIPALAEIFGVTCDELLRGERNNPDREEAYSEEKANRHKAKSDKQLKLMLDTRNRKCNSLTLISLGITILGLIASMVANLGFSKGLIAFCIATAFCIASEICQICFTINVRIMVDEDDDIYINKIQEANTNIVRTATIVSFINILFFSFCLPLVTLINGADYGLAFGDWIGYGSLFSLGALTLCYIIYTLFVRKYLHDRKIITLTNDQTALDSKNRKFLKKVIAISVSIALILIICAMVQYHIGKQGMKKEIEFNNWSDFKAFVENDYDRWFEEEGYTYEECYIDDYDNTVTWTTVDGVSYPNKVYEKYVNRYGELIFEYYYNPDLYRNIWFTEPENGEIQSVTVIMSQNYFNANEEIKINASLLYTLIVMVFAIAASIYLIKVNKNKKKAK